MGMTTPSPAVCPPWRWANRCSSSAPGANIAKCLLYAINGGVDERTGETVVPGIRPILDEVLSYEAVRANYEQVLSYAAELYADTVNIIHYMHDKYAYEASQMALHDTQVERLTAFGIAGLSVAADSLSAIRYASVRPVRNEAGVAVEFETEGDFPKYGNDDDRADDEAVFVVRTFIRELKKHPLYRGAKHTLSALTITSNVMYGKKTGSTPDGRKLGEPLAPGANPMHGRDENGALASLNSVAKIPYRNVCQDGVSNTFSIVPHALGRDQGEREANLVAILDGYFCQGAHHLNVNVLDRATLDGRHGTPGDSIPVSPSVSRATRSTSTACPESSRRRSSSAPSTAPCEPESPGGDTAGAQVLLSGRTGRPPERCFAEVHRRRPPHRGTGACRVIFLPAPVQGARFRLRGRSRAAARRSAPLGKAPAPPGKRALFSPL